MKKIKMLLKWIKPHIPVFLLVSFFAIFLPLTYSYVPQFIRYVFDIIGEVQDGENTLPVFLLNFFGSYTGIKCVIVVCLTLIIYQGLRGVFMFLNGYIKGKLSEGVSFDMRLKLYHKLQNLPASYYNNSDTGDLIQRCTSDIDTIRAFISNQLPNILYILTSILMGAFQMASINVGIMLITMICIPIEIVASIFFFRYVSKKFEEIEEHEAQMTSVLEGSINGVRVVKAFAKEKYEIDRFNKKSYTLSNENKKLNRIMGLYWGFSDGFVSLQYALTLGYCIYLAQSGLKSSDMIVCISYISMLVYPIRNLGRIISDFGKASVASKRIDEILSLDDEYKVNGTLKPEIKGNIEFKNVSFKFDDTNDHLLNDISFNIKAGETVAIVGKTGTGKSTIASILVRMLDYDKGSVLLDGVELKDIDKVEIRGTKAKEVMNSDGKHLGEVEVGAEIYTTEESIDQGDGSKWKKVIYMNEHDKKFKTGYIKGIYIQEKMEELFVDTEKDGGVDLNIRNEADINGSIIGKAKNKSTIKIVDFSDGDLIIGKDGNDYYQTIIAEKVENSNIKEGIDPLSGDIYVDGIKYTKGYVNADYIALLRECTDLER